MNEQIVFLVAAIVLLMTAGRFIFRSGRKGVDWELEVAFIRLEFPPPYRDVAQQIAAGLAEVVGMKIKQLKPEHNLTQIAEWSQNQIQAKDLITLFVVAFNVNCSPGTTFGELVAKVAEKTQLQRVKDRGSMPPG